MDPITSTDPKELGSDLENGSTTGAVDQSTANADKPDSQAADPKGAKTEAASSPDADDKGAKAPVSQRDELLAVVKKAIAKPAVQGNSPDPEQVAGSKTEASATDKDAKAAVADDKLPFHNHPRWKEVLSERDSLKPRAEQFDKIDTYMKTHGITVKETADAFAIMAATKSDPALALEMLKPIYEQLQQIVGDVLPKDLQAKVDEGAVDEATARELARTRGQAALEKTKSERVTERVQSEEAQRAATERANAVNAWEATIAAKDPDYKRKQPLVMDRIKVVLAGLGAKGIDVSTLTVSEANQIAQSAYDHVSSVVRVPTAARPEVRPLRSGGSSAVAPPPPKSSFEAVKAASLAMRG